MDSVIDYNPLCIPSDVEGQLHSVFQNPHYTPRLYAQESQNREQQFERNEIPLHGTDSILVLLDDNQIDPAQDLQKVATPSNIYTHNRTASLHARHSENVGSEHRGSEEFDHLTRGVENPILDTHRPDCASTSQKPRAGGLSGSPSDCDAKRQSKSYRDGSRPHLPAELVMPVSSNTQTGHAIKWGGKTKVYTLSFVKRWFTKRSLAKVQREKDGPSMGREPVLDVVSFNKTEKPSERERTPLISPLSPSPASLVRPTLNPLFQHDSFNYPPFIWDISRHPTLMVRRVDNTPVLSWTETMVRLDEKSRSEYATNPPVREIYINGLADFPLVKVSIGPDAPGDNVSTLPWPIRVRDVSNPMGYVTCGDVFDAIFINFQEFLGEKEMAQMTPFRQHVVHAAYKVRKMRLKDEFGDREPYEYDRGFRRCDYLAMQVMFRGLEPSPDGVGWTLRLGTVIM